MTKFWDKARKYYLNLIGLNPKGSLIIQIGINYEYGERIVLKRKQVVKLIKELKELLGEEK